MRYRVEQLAAAGDVSVDTVRFYQARGLLPRPEREGRVVWYGAEHLERLGRIRDLKHRGFSLAMIGRALSGEIDASEQALVSALAAPLPGEASEERLTLGDLAERTGAPLPLLEALEREGLLVAGPDDERPYTTADAAAVGAGLALLAAGVPLSELLALARAHDEAVRGVAESAVELFARYVRDPVRRAAASDAEAGEVMVQALEAMLPAAEAVVRHHFRRRLLAAARTRIAPESPPALDVEADPETPRQRAG